MLNERSGNAAGWARTARTVLLLDEHCQRDAALDGLYRCGAPACRAKIVCKNDEAVSSLSLLYRYPFGSSSCEHEAQPRVLLLTDVSSAIGLLVNEPA